MTCTEFESQISNFIDDDIDNSVLEDFLFHLNTCKSCYDDIEIFYITNIVLDKVDSDSSISYNFSGELKQIIEDKRKKIRQIMKFRMFTQAVSITANIFVVAGFALFLLLWFKIL